MGIVAVATTSAIGYVASSRDEDALIDVYEMRLESVKQILRLNLSITEMIKRNYQILALGLLPYDEQMREVPASFEHHQKEFANAPNIVKAYVALEAARNGQSSVWPEFEKMWDRWYAIESDAFGYAEKRLENISPESLKAVYAYLLKANLSRRELSAKLGELAEKIANADLKEAQLRYEDAINSSQTMTTIQLIALALAIGTIAAFAWSIFRSVVTPIVRTRDLVVRVEAEQNLGLRVDYKAKDEIGEMVAAFDKMLDKIQSSVISIQERVVQVDKEVDSLNKVAEAVARGSQTQSASTSSMAASMEQMTVSISSVSNNASDAQTMAQNAGAISGDGSKVIAKAVNEMRSTAAIVAQTSRVIQTLGEESHQISSVVQIIRDVADQTNLLALNAAIEAARAGDQGRGFAVVADEVRKLAERTAKSIDDISSMISKIQASTGEAVEEMDKVVRQVEFGQKLTEEAGDKMHALNEQAQQVSRAIDEISSALKEQSVASQDIARNVENIAQMTDKNNESAIGAASGARKLAQLSKEVNATLSQFKADASPQTALTLSRAA
jgi:methyl-accepting chemotaxis protein